MEIQLVSIDSIHPDPANANTHSEEDLRGLMAKLSAFEQVEPLVVQLKTRKVIGGNGRLEAMRRLGWTEVEVNFVDCGQRHRDRDGDRAEYPAVRAGRRHPGPASPGPGVGGLESGFAGIHRGGSRALPGRGSGRRGTSRIRMGMAIRISSPRRNGWSSSSARPSRNRSPCWTDSRGRGWNAKRSLRERGGHRRVAPRPSGGGHVRCPAGPEEPAVLGLRGRSRPRAGTSDSSSDPRAPANRRWCATSSATVWSNAGSGRQTAPSSTASRPPWGSRTSSSCSPRSGSRPRRHGSGRSMPCRTASSSESRSPGRWRSRRKWRSWTNSPRSWTDRSPRSAVPQSPRPCVAGVRDSSRCHATTTSSTGSIPTGSSSPTSVVANGGVFKDGPRSRWKSIRSVALSGICLSRITI